MLRELGKRFVLALVFAVCSAWADEESSPYEPQLLDSSASRSVLKNAEALFQTRPSAAGVGLLEQFQKGATWTCQLVRQTAKAGPDERLSNLYLDTLKRLKKDPARLNSYLEAVADSGAEKVFAHALKSADPRLLEEVVFRFPLTVEAGQALRSLIRIRWDRNELFESSLYIRHFIDFYPFEKLPIPTLFRFSSLLKGLTDGSVKDWQLEKVQSVLVVRRAELVAWQDEETLKKLGQQIQDSIVPPNPEPKAEDPDSKTLTGGPVKLTPKQVDFVSMGLSAEAEDRSAYRRLMKLHPVPFVREVFSSGCSSIDPLATLEASDSNFEILDFTIANLPAPLARDRLKSILEEGSQVAAFRLIQWLEDRPVYESVLNDSLLNRLKRRESGAFRGHLLSKIEKLPLDSRKKMVAELVAEYLAAGDIPAETIGQNLSDILSELFLIAPELGPSLNQALHSGDEVSKTHAAELMAKVNWIPATSVDEMEQIFKRQPASYERYLVAGALTRNLVKGPKAEALLTLLGEVKDPSDGVSFQVLALNHFERLCRQGYGFSNPRFPFAFLGTAAPEVLRAALDALSCLLDSKHAGLARAVLLETYLSGSESEKVAVIQAYSNRPLNREGSDFFESILINGTPGLRTLVLRTLGTLKNPRRLRFPSLEGPISVELTSPTFSEDTVLAVAALGGMGDALQGYRKEFSPIVEGLDDEYLLQFVQAWIEGDPNNPDLIALMKKWLMTAGSRPAYIAGHGIWKSNEPIPEILKTFEAALRKRSFPFTLVSGFISHLPELGPYMAGNPESFKQVAELVKACAKSSEFLVGSSIRSLALKHPIQATQLAGHLAELLSHRPRHGLGEIQSKETSQYNAVIHAIARAPLALGNAEIDAYVMPAFRNARGVYGDSEQLLSILSKKAEFHQPIRDELEKMAWDEFNGDGTLPGLPPMGAAGFYLVGNCLFRGYEEHPEELEKWFTPPAAEKDSARFRHLQSAKKLIALGILSELGERSHLPKIHALLQDSDANVQFYAALALFELDPKELADKAAFVAGLFPSFEPGDGDRSWADQERLMKEFIRRYPSAAIEFARAYRRNENNSPQSRSLMSPLLKMLFGTDGRHFSDGHGQRFSDQARIEVPTDSPFLSLNDAAKEALLRALATGLRDTEDARGIGRILRSVAPALWDKIPLQLRGA